MTTQIILASGSAVRAQLLGNAGVNFAVKAPRLDEETIKAAMLAEQAKPRDVADALAEMKARKVSDKHPGSLVIGCDQVLDFQGSLISKPSDRDDACQQLKSMRGKAHALFSAAVIYENGQPLWRHVGRVRLHMRDMSDGYISRYLERNWDSVKTCVGAYKLEEEGVRLFTLIEGDYFTVLGMPLLDILNYLTLRGELDQ